MNKRITSILLTIVMVLSLLATAVPVFAITVDNGVSLSKTEVSPGGEFKVTVSVPEITDLLYNLEMELEFDKTVFEVTEYTPGEIPGGILMYSEPFEANAAGAFTYTQSGIAGGNTINASNGYSVTATFKVKEGVALKEYVFNLIKLNVDAADEDNYGIPINKLPSGTVKTATLSVVAAPVPATGITLNKNTTTITAGQNETLTATVEPATSTDSVTWESDNTAVATVDDSGKVTAVAKGTATITAKAGTKSATCTVTVTCAHANTTNVPAEASTCLVAGHGAYTKCDDCGEITVGSDAALPLADHTYGTWIDEVPATHTANGTKGHYECSVCHKYFDAAYAEIADLTVSKEPHGTAGDTWQKDASNHWKDCVVTGCGVIIESTKAAHSFEWVIDTPATEEAVGSKHEECTVCHYARAAVEIPKLDHTHTGITKHEAVAATCTSKGTVEYWTCSSPKCAGKYYSDAACTTEITTIETAIDSTNHTGGTEIRNATEATCNTAGYTGDTYCKGCNAKIATGKSIPATGNHTDENGKWETDADNHWHTCGCGTIIDKAAHKDGEATCVAKKVCSVCGKEYGTVDSSKHMHTEIRDAKAATEDEEGYTGDTWCTDCNTKIATGTAIAKLTHTHSGTLVSAKEPTFTEEGNKAYYICSCDKWFEDAACTVEITDHSSVIIPTLEYEFTAGNNGSYTKGSGKDLRFVTNGAMDDCDGIKIDGFVLDKANYTLESGSTIITLKNAYLETLDVGSHTITAIYGRQEPTANFNIAAASATTEPSETTKPTDTTKPSETNTPTSPKTGDNSNMILWIALLFVSGAGVFGATLYGKKKRNRA